MPDTYQLTLTEEQCRVLMQALELHARIGLGQLEAILEHPHALAGMRKQGSSREAVKAVLNTLRWRVFGQWGGVSASITATEVSEAARITWDAYQTIRHRLSWDAAGNPSERDPNTMLTVNFGEPLKTVAHPLPAIERVTKAQEEPCSPDCC